MPHITLINLKKLLLVISLFFLILSCSETSTEQKINAQIVNMQQAISDKSLADFMGYFAKDFIGNKRHTRNDLRRLIYFHFQRNRTIETYKWQADIKVENKNALVKIYVIVSGSNKNLPERGRAYLINSSWENRDESWLIVSAEWKDAIVDY